MPSSALKGIGVGKTLRACLKLVLMSLQNEMQQGGEGFNVGLLDNIA